MIMSKVLIVEDEEAIAEIEKDYLELSGFDVTIRSDGESGSVISLQKPEGCDRYSRRSTSGI